MSLPKYLRPPRKARLGVKCCKCGELASYVAHEDGESKNYCLICWLALPDSIKDVSRE
jgi:formylmethanofuran dehydrogenase subunit E